MNLSHYYSQFFQEDVVEQISEPGTCGVIIVRCECRHPGNRGTHLLTTEVLARRRRVGNRQQHANGPIIKASSEGRSRRLILSSWYSRYLARVSFPPCGPLLSFRGFVQEKHRRRSLWCNHTRRSGSQAGACHKRRSSGRVEDHDGYTEQGAG